MKLTQSQLKRIIKEELAKVMNEGLSDQATDIHATLRNIAYWMQENGFYSPDEGVKAWLELADQEADRLGEAKISAEKRQALIDMASQIYDYM